MLILDKLLLGVIRRVTWTCFMDARLALSVVAFQVALMLVILLQYNVSLRMKLINKSLKGVES
jgi:hypothetical protein